MKKCANIIRHDFGRNCAADGVWLSLVERYVRDVEVAGSNPVTPMIKTLDFSRVFLFLTNG